MLTKAQNTFFKIVTTPLQRLYLDQCGFDRRKPKPKPHPAQRSTALINALKDPTIQNLKQCTLHDLRTLTLDDIKSLNSRIKISPELILRQFVNSPLKPDYFNPKENDHHSSFVKGRERQRRLRHQFKWSSTWVMAIVATMSRLFLRCFTTVKTYNLYNLTSLVLHRAPGRGLLTIANHASTLDDPLLWQVLPWMTILRHRLMRWSLGARELMFMGKAQAWFFGSGQVIPTIRGGGINQTAIDHAVDILNRGGWVHIFPEAKISQNSIEKPLLPFKWGVGRLLTEPRLTPVVVPIIHHGLQDIMPEPNPRYPRPFQTLHVMVGNPILRELEALKRSSGKEHNSLPEEVADISHTVNEDRAYYLQKPPVRRNPYTPDGHYGEADIMRWKVTTLLYWKMEELRQRLHGRILSGKDPSAAERRVEEDPEDYNKAHHET